MTDMLPNRSLTRWLIVVVIAVITGLTGIAGWWMVAGHALDTAITRWAKEQTREGYSVTLSIVDNSGGFPFTVHRRLGAFEMKGPGGTIHADSGELAIDLADTSTVRFRFTGASAIASSGAVTARGDLDGKVSLLPAYLAGGGTVPAQADVTATSAAWSFEPGWQWRAERLAFQLTASEIPPNDHTAEGMTLGVRADGLALPEPLAGLVDGKVGGTVAVDIAVLGRPPLPQPEPLTAWRADGGTVEMRHLAVTLGPLTAKGDATLALDRDLQPQGAGTLHLTGADTLADRLKPDAPEAAAADQTAAKPHLLSPKHARQLRQTIKMLSQPDPAGGAPTMTLPLTVQDRKLYVGPFVVAKFVTVNW